MPADLTAYAEALQAVGRPVATWQALRSLERALAELPRFKQLAVATGVRSPAARRREFDQLLTEWPVPVRRLVGLLAEQQELDRFGEIVQVFTKRLSEAGYRRVSVESAAPLSEPELAAVLRGARIDRRKALLETRVRPDLIGGVRLTVDDAEYDETLGGLLDRVADALGVRT